MIIIRCVLLLVFLGLFLVFQNSVFRRGKNLVLVLAVLAIIVGTIFPVENLIISFSEPEAAFSYAKNGDVIDVVTGVSSCMIVYQTDSGYDTWLIPKTKDGYKLPSFYGTHTCHLQMASNEETINASVFIKQIGTDSYFQTGFVSDACPTVKDVNGKSISTLANDIPGTETVFVFAYGCISDPLDEFQMMINENTVVLIRPT